MPLFVISLKMHLAERNNKTMIILKIMGTVFIICGFLLICCLIGAKLTGEYNWKYGKLERLYDFFKSVNTWLIVVLSLDIFMFLVALVLSLVAMIWE